MQAWEKHQVDLYLLATDILDNYYYQPDGYKGQFYYGFNGDLGLLQSKGTYSDQIKLLDKLVSLGAVTYTIKTPLAGLAKEYFGKNALNAPRENLVIIKLNESGFNKAYKDLERFNPKQEKVALPGEYTVRLRKDDTRLYLEIDQTRESHLLKAFRHGLPPDRLFTYLVNVAPDTKVTRSMLGEARIYFLKRKLSEVVDKTLQPMARREFFPISRPDVLQIRKTKVIKPTVLDEILDELKAKH